MRYAILSMLVMLACSCKATLGERYEPRKTLPGSMAIIYLYSGDIDTLQKVYVDREPQNPAATHSITMIKDGYFPYMAPAGPVRILTTAGKEPFCISMETLPGFQYWVRVAGKKADTQRIEAVPADVGQSEISAHREIGIGARKDATGVYDIPCPENAAAGKRL